MDTRVKPEYDETRRDSALYSPSPRQKASIAHHPKTDIPHVIASVLILSLSKERRSACASPFPLSPEGRGLG